MEIHREWYELLLTAAILGQAGQPQQAPPIEGSEGAPWLSGAEQQRIRGLWPASVPFPEGTKFYKRTQWTQYLSYDGKRNVPIRLSDNAPIPTNPKLINPEAYFINPNKEFPWRVNGGLEQLTPDSRAPRLLTGWASHVAMLLPPGGKIKVRTAQVETGFVPEQGKIVGGGGGFGEQKLWEFPDGTRDFDLLVTPRGAFELRQKTMGANNQWRFSVLFKDAYNRPAGYEGGGLPVAASRYTCAVCHTAYNGHVDYLIRKRGGQSGNLSFPVLVEGTLEWNTALPLEIR